MDEIIKESDSDRLFRYIFNNYVIEDAYDGVQHCGTIRLGKHK